MDHKNMENHDHHMDSNQKQMSNMSKDDMSDMDMSSMDHGSMPMGHMNHGDMKKRLIICIFLMIPILLLTPMMGMKSSILHLPYQEIIVLIFGTIIFFYGGKPFFEGAKSELKNKKPEMMTLVTLGISVSYLYSVYSTIINMTGGHQMDFWWELSTLIVIMLLGHIIEMNAIMQANSSMTEMVKLLPHEAHLTSGKDIPINQVKVGDSLLVKENERVPADGTITSDKAMLDESMITGESSVVQKKKGQEVFAGSLNKNYPFELKVTVVGKDSYLSQVAKLVEEAQGKKSKAETMADKVSSWLFYAALIFAILALIIWSAINGLSYGIMMAVTVLVIACPHALGLAIPLVVSRTSTLAAKNGLLIQNREPLENVSKLKFALMDKTGTLTDGDFKVHDYMTFSKEFSQKDIAQIMAALEEGSTHPLAQALVEAVSDNSLKANNIENIPGVGIEGNISGKEYKIVNEKYLKENGINYNKIDNEDNLTVSYLISGNEVIGLATLGDKLKPQAETLIKELKNRGIEPVMLTGDNEKAAQKVASELGINDFRAQLKPEDKAKIVKEYQEKGNVLFVGDGVNDSPALATSDLSFAIGSGTSVAIAAADVILVNSNPEDIIKMLDLAKNSNRKMKENLWWGAGYNIIAIPLAAGVLAPIGIVLSPIVGAIIMSFSTVIVAINAMTLKV
ncbi:ATPase [Floricoccus penangensis]|uniref:P-type Cu(+) transporter n=1 Tax=Floricoccus penangensis TaxID=1859475 RepID=A0A9Q5JH01_9LACT|nr:copper-translocating P-type ATPase [Floricoccus penangensis]OFI46797.1 ATPase [Floricoccus penangensis]